MDNQKQTGKHDKLAEYYTYQFRAILCDMFGALSKNTVKFINDIIYAALDTSEGALKTRAIENWRFQLSASLKLPW